jgi:guanyl-specific ribonuclease Sa
MKNIIFLFFGWIVFLSGCDGSAPSTPPPAQTPPARMERPAEGPPVVTVPHAQPPTASQARPAAASVPQYVQDVLTAIQERHGEPLPGYVGGRLFQNRERRLPRGRYREYDVHPKVRGTNRGPERIVINQESGLAYYSADHYRTFTPLNPSP